MPESLTTTNFEGPVLLYRDDDIMAVLKPAGLKMHRSAKDSSSQPFLLQLARDLAGCRVYPVHRLDRPTSGIVLFALNSENAHMLADAFKNQRICKTYVAVVRGILSSKGSIDYPLTADAGAPKAGQIVKRAITDFEPLATAEMPFAVGRYATTRYCLSVVYPRTGRMHQIRRHFHHISHPIIGDTIYGDGRHNRFFRDYFGCRRLLLAAVEVQLNHPRTGRLLHLRAPLEASFERVICQIGWQHALPERWRSTFLAMDGSRSPVRLHDISHNSF